MLELEGSQWASEICVSAHSARLAATCARPPRSNIAVQFLFHSHPWTQKYFPLFMRRHDCWNLLLSGKHTFSASCMKSTPDTVETEDKQWQWYQCTERSKLKSASRSRSRSYALPLNGELNIWYQLQHGDIHIFLFRRRIAQSVHLKSFRCRFGGKCIVRE